MRKSRYDDEVFFEKYGQMARSRLGLSGAGEWETLEPLLPDFAGKAGAGPWDAATAGTASTRRSMGRRPSPAWTCRKKCWPWPGRRPSFHR